MRMILLILSILLSYSLYCQEKDSIKVSFVKNDKEINTNEFSFYVIKENKAYPILIKNGYLDISSLDEDNTILFIYKNNKIEFKIKPHDIFYLKIKKKCEGFFKLCRCKYIISQGFDYVDVVTHSKNKYIIINDRNGG